MKQGVLMISHRICSRFEILVWRCLEVAGLAAAITLALVMPVRGAEPTDSTVTATYLRDRPQVSTSQVDLFRPAGYGATVEYGMPMPPPGPAAETLAVPAPPPQGQLVNVCVGDCGGPADVIVPAELPYSQLFPPPVRPLFATPQQILFTGTPANPSVIGFKQTFF
jgi:hypothetical protein